MFNRYGLVDIEKLLREQDEPPPPPPPEGGAPPAPEGGQEAPPPPEEDPDEKVKTGQDKARAEDLEEFRRKHADAIYRLVQAYKLYRKAGSGATDRNTLDPSSDERYSFNTQNQNLKNKFEDSGVDAPFIAAFDQGSTGLDGDMHVRFLTAIHGGHAGGRGRFMFPSPGAAKEFAEAAGQLRDDLEFEVQRGDPRVVSYTEHQEQPEPQEPPPATPPQAEG